MIKKILISFVCLSSLLLANEVTVSILPQKYFIEKIAKDKVNVNVMVKPGFSPATYEPKVSQMRKLASSKIYFSIGVPFEDIWLDRFKASNKDMIVLDTSKGIKKLEMEAHEHHDEESEEHGQDEEKAHNEHEHDNHEDEKHDEHKEDHEHDKHDEHADEKHDDYDDHEDHKHTGLDPHIWLDPILVKTQAKNIYDALVKIDEKNSAFYTNNYENFIKELDALHLELKAILKPYEHRAFMVFHPSWGYFASSYDLEQIAIEVQGKEPKPAQLVELVEEAKKHDIKIVFVSPQFSKKGAKTISKNINGNVSVIDPLSFQWKENLLKSAKEIAKSYK